MNIGQGRLDSTFLIIALGILLGGCGDNSTSVDTEENGPNNPEFEVSDTTTINIVPGKTYQTIRNFGGSDAWSAEFIGNWSASVKENASQLLFSQETDDSGDPRGIGLSGWRFNIGVGRGQLEGSGYATSSWYRVEECFMNLDGTWDWDRQKGQRWFLNEAKAYGVDQFTGWINSPPYFMTKNGYTFRTNEVSGYNLDPENYADYAEFIAGVASHFEEQGTPFDVISPVNEPQYGWQFQPGNAKQAGSYASNMEIANLTRVIDSAFTAENVDSQIMIPEAGAVDHLYEGRASQTTNQIHAFWNPGSDLYLGDLSNLSPYVAGHSYWTNTTVSATVNSRTKLLEQLNSTDPNLEFWQTEYSILGADYLQGDTRADLNPIDYALWISRIIHYDLTVANATSWSFWSVFNNSDYRDHRFRFGLIQWTPDVDNRSTTSGTIEPVKNLWAYGNFSRFVRPGMKRIQVDNITHSEPEAAGNNVMASAFLDVDTDEIVIVLINYSNDNQKISIPDLSVEGNWDVYITSDFRDLDHKVYDKDNVKILSKSITTLVGTLN